jgi:REP element-mobilizing transposase RayT
MAYHTFVSNRVHVVFSTKERRPIIPKDTQQRLWAYMAGTARQLGIQVYAVGGMADHAHVLIGLPAAHPLAKAVQAIKANSSRWLKENGNVQLFAWQEGYAAFSVSLSQTDATIRYIQNQPNHHQRRDFDAELALMLRRRGFGPVDAPH